ncbi:MAG: Mur ligase family protein [Burkholderiales bacterium]
MRYDLRDIVGLLRTPAGRLQLREGISRRAWPVTSRPAWLYRRSLARQTRVIAVVGSFGKSTTTRCVAAALGAPMHPRMVLNSWSSVAFALLRIRPTQRNAVIEVGISGCGQMEPYARVVQPDVTVVTAIGSEHHRSLGTLEVTRAEKSAMVRALPRSGTAVLNGDDLNVIWMAGLTAARTVTFGFGETCDVRAAQFRFDWPHGSRFDLTVFGRERKDVTVKLVGRKMIYPTLAAIAVAHLEGIALEETLDRLQALAPTPGRMQPVSLPNGVVVLRDDFKSTLETIDAALDVFGEIPAARRVVVLGEVSEPPVGGWRPTYRALGARVAEVASLLVVVGNGFDAYSSGARRAGMPKSAIIDAGRTPRQVADALRTLLQPGDVVLIKGRHSQKLDRVRLILEGRRVRCDMRFCGLRTMGCDRCPALERA